MLLVDVIYVVLEIIIMMDLEMKSDKVFCLLDLWIGIEKLFLLN